MITDNRDWSQPVVEAEVDDAPLFITAQVVLAAAHEVMRAVNQFTDFKNRTGIRSSQRAEDMIESFFQQALDLENGANALLSVSREEDRLMCVPGAWTCQQPGCNCHFDGLTLEEVTKLEAEDKVVVTNSSVTNDNP